MIIAYHAIHTYQSILLYHIISYNIIFHYIIFHNNIISYHIIPYHIISYHIITHYNTIQHISPGTLATEDVIFDETYLEVPQSLILDSETALTSASVGKLIDQLMQKYNNRRDDLHELLFFLLYETMVLGEASIYWPYLALLPMPGEQDVPLVWTKEQIMQVPYLLIVLSYSTYL